MSMLNLNKENYFIVFVNGEPFNCSKYMSIKDLLLYLNFNLNNVIVEYNKKIINSNDFNYLFLQLNDSIEVITIVGGG